MSTDGRIGVVFGPASLAGAEDAVLQAPADMLRHRAGCTCCGGRGPLAEALGRLYIARARGDVAFFRRVIVVGASVEARAALAGDALVSARFQLVAQGEGSHEPAPI